MDDFYADRRAQLNDELAATYRAAQKAGAKGPKDLEPWVEHLQALLQQLKAIDGHR